MKQRHRKHAIALQAKRVIRARWREKFHRMAKAQLSSYMSRLMDQQIAKVFDAAMTVGIGHEEVR